MDTPDGLPCVHCGLCLDTCPTYRLLGREADSPRGRIHIMQAIDAGELNLDREAAGHLDRCLGCLACETACPSGVSFGARIEKFRPRILETLPRRPWRSLIDRAVRQPAMIRLATVAAAVLDAIGLNRLRRRLPGLALMPDRHRRTGREPAGRGATPAAEPELLTPVASAPRVAVLRGCVAHTLLPAIHEAAVEVLRQNGFDVIEIEETCCGALDAHAGRLEEARRKATETVETMTALGITRLVTTAAGCGAQIREYDRLFGDGGGSGSSTPRTIAEAAMDVSELLAEIGPRPPKQPLDAGKVVYHDACHLRHASGITQAPREIVRAATGCTPEDLGENHLCCGSAGSYNLEHVRLARAMGDRKAELAAVAEAETIAVGNVGCVLQIERALSLQGLKARVRHPVELLAEAYRREETGGSSGMKTP